MGFITPSHVWEETDSEVTVLVEVKGVPRSSFDVFASSAFLKVNAPPYLFSCDLEGDIDDDACVATIDDRGVEFRCPKANPGTRWGRLRRESTRETKSDVAERRRRSVEAAHARVRAERLAAKEAKAKADKAYQEKQWAIEQKRRETIEARQDAEMALERERIRKWQARTDREAAGLDPDVDSEDDEVAYDSDDDAATRAAKEARTRVAREREFAASVLTPDAVAAAEGPDAARPEESRVPEEALDRMLLEDDDDEAASVEAKAKAEAKAEAEAKAKARAATRPVPVRELPPPRASSRVEVTFTKLETDHMPARASREREIREWKRSRRKPGAGDGDGDAPRDVTEREPIFLKDKGDAFFKAGNYRSALEAYTAAVDAEREAPHPDGTLVRLYANRAACYLKGGDAHAAEEDCTSALRLLESEAVDEDSGARWTPDALRAQRLRLITRRARAYVAVDRIDDARRDLEAATRLAPHDATLARDLRDVSACAAPLDAAAARSGRRAIPRGGHRRRRSCLRRRHRHVTARVLPRGPRGGAREPRRVSSLAIGSRRRARRLRRRTRRVAERRGRRRRARQRRRATFHIPNATPGRVAGASREAVASPGRRRRAPSRVRRRRRGLRRGGGVRDDGTRRRRAPTRRGNRPSAREEVGGGERDDVSVIPAFGRGARRENGIVGWKRGNRVERGRRGRDEVDDDASRGRGRARGSNR